ncbi:MAG: transporter substrate-binding domain-containing protein [Mesorhizobium sp.]|jgi:polar amino acid transport system substrate-binding protein|nr:MULTISPECIES: transporter substrate-binding domain-containing protein [Mesorhizobium]MBN9217123.1 transporter substrate-binding domain-containing protein [Mesorhizobium sp.]
MDESRRNFLSGLPAIGAAAAIAGAAAATGASAQEAPVSGEDAFARIRKNGVIRFGAANSEPWYFKDVSGSDAPGGVESNGVVWRGVCPALAKMLADAMGVKLELVETTWGNAVAGLQAGQFDVMLALDGTPTRALAIDFITTQMAWNPFNVLVADGVNAANWSDLNNPEFSVAVMLGTSMDQFISKLLPKAEIVRFQEASQTYAAFQGGRVKGITGAGPEMDLLREKLKIGNVVIPKPLFAIPSGAGLPYEPTPRLRDYLSTSVGYLYFASEIQNAYEDYARWRGLDPSKSVPLMRERLL